MFLLDFYRQVPIATEQQASDEIVPQSTAKEVYDFIESELKECIPTLPERKTSRTLDTGTGSRFVGSSLFECQGVDW